MKTAGLAKAGANSDTSTMIAPTYLTHQFLIAMPALADPNFHQTVTYIGEHTEKGALGLIINRPSGLILGEIWAHLDITSTELERGQSLIYRGGPVQPEQGFVLHTPLGEWELTLQVTDDIGITTSRDILQAMARGEGPQDALVGFGYAGWGPGQLERELGENTWLSCPADTDVLFQTPHTARWAAAAALLGVDMHLLTSRAGHA